MIPAKDPLFPLLNGISALFLQTYGQGGPLTPSCKIDCYGSDILFVFPREPLT